MFHQSEHVYPVSGADINALAVQEGFFGTAQDIVININGQYDLTARWIRAASPTQYEKNVPLYKIFKYTMHDISDSCATQQMNYQAVHILLVGNFDDNAPSIAQQEAVRKIIVESVYHLPTLRDVLFHSEIEGISCPGLFMRPNQSELKKIFADARNTIDRTMYEPLPNIVPVLSVVESTSSHTNLAWSTVSAAINYRLYRKHLGVDSEFILLNTSSLLTYTDTDISVQDVYQYFITAILPITGEGPTSNIVNVTVPPVTSLFSYDISTGGLEGSPYARTTLLGGIKSPVAGGPATMTLEFWLRMNTAPTTTFGSLIIMNKWFIFQVANTTNNIWWSVQPNANYPSTYVNSGIAIPVGEIHHWAFVVDTANNSGYYMTVYRDGIVIYPRTFNGKDATGSDTLGTFLYIGSNFSNVFNPPTCYSFVSDYDELRIWNIDRTQSQIQSTMNQALVAPQTNLIGRWGFDITPFVNDTSGTNNDLQNVNGGLIGSAPGLF
jgi:hypothetical protein